MKKLLVFILVLTFAFSLSACSLLNNMTDGNQKNSDISSNTNSMKDNNVSEVKLTEDEALKIALDKANVSREDISNLKIELDRDNGVYHYDIDFYVGQTEYDYDIHAVDGTVLEHDMDID